MTQKSAQNQQNQSKSTTKRRSVSSTIGLPKGLFFLAAGISFVLSVSLFFTGSREQGIFVGIWVPSILSAGGLLLGGRNS
jgi:hypothetical protein